MSAESISGEPRSRYVELEEDSTDSGLTNTLGGYGLTGAGTDKPPYKKPPPMHDGYALMLEVECVLNGSGWPGEFPVDPVEQLE